MLVAGPGEHTEWWTAFHWANNATRAGGTIALVGDRGTGKTQLVTELIRTNTIMADHPKRCLYVRAAELFQQIRECYGPLATRRETDVLRTFYRPWLLAIDEAHDRAHSDAEGRMLNLIVDKRYGCCWPTVFIANATPEEFRAQVGESIFDRMSETGGIMPCDWKSFRTKE